VYCHQTVVFLLQIIANRKSDRQYDRRVNVKSSFIQ
jgi:hypothetical protein